MSEPAPTPRPLTIQVPDEVLADLRQRLDRVRWPDEIPAAGWDDGTGLAYMQGRMSSWREAYDWRTHEALLNGFKQYTVPLGGIDLHVIAMEEPEALAADLRAFFRELR
jgi:hypothetical protein